MRSEVLKECVFTALTDGHKYLDRLHLLVSGLQQLDDHQQDHVFPIEMGKLDAILFRPWKIQPNKEGHWPDYKDLEELKNMLEACRYAAKSDFCQLLAKKDASVTPISSLPPLPTAPRKPIRDALPHWRSQHAPEDDHRPIYNLGQPIRYKTELVFAPEGKVAFNTPHFKQEDNRIGGGFALENSMSGLFRRIASPSGAPPQRATFLSGDLSDSNLQTTTTLPDEVMEDFPPKEKTQDAMDRVGASPVMALLKAGHLMLPLTPVFDLV
ncbi:hypothetical protein NUW54_g1646 [Trametes sanguinea]|uniref:Uncharacterized protein n=1 Tax=Trametes sanguinea TaxID=158606 RepID=A0ACC1Q605_9APHY|nr:hypothetical protein NUW54_g1646 [Trametes sanguinea]